MGCKNKGLKWRDRNLKLYNSNIYHLTSSLMLLISKLRITSTSPICLISCNSIPIFMLTIYKQPKISIKVEMGYKSYFIYTEF